MQPGYVCMHGVLECGLCGSSNVVAVAQAVREMNHVCGQWLEQACARREQVTAAQPWGR